MRFQAALATAFMCTSLLGAEARAQSAPTTLEAPAADALTGAPVAAPERTPGPSAGATVSAISPAPPSPSPTEPYSEPLMISGVAVGILGVGALATGAVVFATGSHDCIPDDRANCDLTTALGSLWLAGGALGTLGGLGLWMIGSDEIPVEKAAVEPRRWVSIGAGSVVVGATF